MRKYLGLAVLLLNAGCANPYQKFYYPAYNPPITGPPTATAPMLYRGNADNVADDVATMNENNFVMIGYSAFNGAAVDVSRAAEFGKAIRAAAIVVYGKYTDTLSGSIPILVPNPPVTSTTYVQGTVSGAGGTASYSGTGTTTTSGGYSTYSIPWHVDRYNQGAAYFVRAARPTYGVFLNNLSPDQRAQLQRNRGCVVTAVVHGSPAFLADILRGDVVIEIGGDEVDDMQTALALMRMHAGQPTVFKVIRSGKVLEITVHPNPLQ